MGRGGGLAQVFQFENHQEREEVGHRILRPWDIASSNISNGKFECEKTNLPRKVAFWVKPNSGMNEVTQL